MGVGVVGVRVCRYLDKRVGMGVYIGECVEKRAMGRGSGEGEEGGAEDGRSRGRKGKRGRAEGVGGGSCVQWGDGAGKGREKRET